MATWSNLNNQNRTSFFILLDCQKNILNSLPVFINARKKGIKKIKHYFGIIRCDSVAEFIAILNHSRTVGLRQRLN